MKRIIAVLLILLVFYVNVSAAYPCSSRENTSGGTLLEGEIFGTESYHNSGDTYDKAWDGDRSTHFGPKESATDMYYTGIKTEVPYILTEIRILPRENWADRFLGAEIQGSNDGREWFSIWKSDYTASSVSFQYIGADEFNNNTGYTMFRFVNTVSHGDVAEIELYGTETVFESEEEIAAREKEAEEYAAMLAEREEIEKHVRKAPAVGDRTTSVIIPVMCISGAALIVIIILSKRRR